jgi:SP family general alpha glucoside:H+ symporter-like MFS transporter
LKARAVQDPLDWKNMIYTQYAMVGLSVIAAIIMPESPWWLISKGKNAAARKILVQKFANVEGYDIDTELASREKPLTSAKHRLIEIRRYPTGNHRSDDRGSKEIRSSFQGRGSVCDLQGTQSKAFPHRIIPQGWFTRAAWSLCARLTFKTKCQVLQQFVGLSIFSSYASYVFAQAGNKVSVVPLHNERYSAEI